MSPKTSTKRKKKQNNRTTIIVVAALAIIMIAAFIFAPKPAFSVLPAEVNVAKAYAMQAEGAFILDVRTPEEWEAGHVPGAALIPLDELQARLSEVPENQEIVVICNSGNRSATGRDILLYAGFEAVTSVTGGFNDWSAAGFPVEVGP